MILYPYKNGSQSAKALAGRLGIVQIKKENSKFVGSPEKLVINWGNSSSTREVDKCMILNKPEAVAICSDKLKFLNHITVKNNNLEGYCSIPSYTTDANLAMAWCEQGNKVVCRTVLNGHSGEGIVIANTSGEVVRAPLYVLYVPKKSEFRVHIFHDAVVDVQRKARDVNIPDDQINWQIRNHQFGFNFVREGVMENIPKKVLTYAVTAVTMCGLDFGAVDVIYNERSGQAYVLEVNTAPGLTGATLDGYEARFKEFGEAYKDYMNKRKGPRLDGVRPMLVDQLRQDLIADVQRHIQAAAQPDALPQPQPVMRRGRHVR